MIIRKVKSPFEWWKLRKLYIEAFPRYERKPLKLIRTMNRKGKSDIWVIDKDGQFSGLAITMNEQDLILLDYFAISAKKRGGGLGAEALKKLQELYKGKRFFLEIESVYMEADNLEERRRRKNFYLKNGMKEMKVMAHVWSTDMELLGYECQVTFDDYYGMYEKHFGPWVKKNLIRAAYPE